MEVEQFTSLKFTSNTYKISAAKSRRVWLVDLGSFDQVLNSLLEEQYVEGVLLTHYHYDHIYGINQLIEVFPSCKIYASAHTIEGLYDPKMNLSFYRGESISYNGEKPEVLNDGDEISLFDDIKGKVIYTPGHNPGCLTYETGNYLFTGDSYIPHVDVVTKMKYGKKTDSRQSLIKIRDLLRSETIICPGHGALESREAILPHIENLINRGVMK